MMKNPELARGRLSSSQVRKDYSKLWSELTNKLNSLGLGQKSVDKWQKSWSDYKLNLKKKAAEIERSRNLTGGGPACSKTLNDFELKILEILGESFLKELELKN
ncbi:unnamed protein product [Acanthoscelides obtectus]|uniref:Regulatory protein zeste n=1 Tax=Acanthoscelides obtectus TaxID=200917 RepID=A0A9P0L081_ACAOB|nr:unnamed protein product [Acanthoscelides obtectus]CAK1655924.1 hypothetical protein AOBTE_LOCUS19443 [Acanthoscelides obtectus]